MTTIDKVGDGTSFVGNCPLWTYVLAETIESTETVKTLDGDKAITHGNTARLAGGLSRRPL